jgi:hypothetical protein
MFEGRRVMPVSPDGFSAIIPSNDPEDMAGELASPPDLESIAGVGCILTYLDSRGDDSVRRVTCRRLSVNAGTLSLEALCHERSARRTFRLDRIVEVACGASGEVYVPPSLFFSRFVIVEGTGSVIGFGLNVQAATDLRACLNVLTFIGRVDGRFIRTEKEVLEEFCQAYALRYASDNFNLEGAMRYAKDLSPDSETFYVALERLMRPRAPAGLRELLARFSVRIMDADGIQDEREFRYLCAVRDYLLS